MHREIYRYILLCIAGVIFLSSLILSLPQTNQYLQDILKYTPLSFQSRQRMRYGEDYYNAVESAKKYLRRVGGKKLFYIGSDIINGFSSIWLTQHLISPEFEYASKISEADILIVEEKIKTLDSEIEEIEKVNISYKLMRMKK